MDKTKCFFAASNTTEGFVSYYGSVFGELDRIYVIKGGSGTGKSRLIKEIGAHAEKEGADTEYFFCSFDPDSLDGIIINRSTAVIDGTAPHLFEPRLPGARDNIIDLGRFWSSDILYTHKKRLTELSSHKKDCFDLAYTYLSGAEHLSEANRVIAQKYIKRDILEHKLSSLCKTAQCNDAFPRLRLTSAFGKRGIVSLDSYMSSPNSAISVSDEYKTFTVGQYLDEIPKKKAEMYSFSPLKREQVNAILLSNGISIAEGEENGDVDVSEFASPEFRSETGRLRENALIRDSLLKLAEEQLHIASEIHTEIEKIYMSAMDFVSKEKYTAELLNSLKY